MFDFLKDTWLQAQGIDISKAEKIKKQKKEKIILSLPVKIAIWVMGVIYLVVAAFGIMALIETGVTPVIIKFIVLILIDTTILILITIKSKATELAGLAGIALFFIINTATSFLV